MPSLFSVLPHRKSVRWDPAVRPGDDDASVAGGINPHSDIGGGGRTVRLAAVTAVLLLGMSAAAASVMVNSSSSLPSSLSSSLGLRASPKEEQENTKDTTRHALFDPETYDSMGLGVEDRMGLIDGGQRLESARDEALVGAVGGNGGYRRKLQGLSGFAGTGPSESDTVRMTNQVLTSYDTSANLALPSFYDYATNVWDTLTAQDQPFLWYVPKAGGNTFNKVLSHCLGMVTCSSVAATVTGGLDPANSLVINTFPDGAKYINVDPSTTEGIAKASTYGLVATRAAEAIITQRLSEGAALFTSSNKGRLFVMLRHPVKRVVDQFYYRQRATWDNYDTSLATMTLDEFAASDRVVENFVVRSLVGKVERTVTADDVTLAKEILRRKFMVGIAEWYDLSVVRFEKYFGWWDEYGVLTNATINYCHYDRILTGGHIGSHPRADPETQAYKKLAVRNWADTELYFYAKNLFYQQAALV